MSGAQSAQRRRIGIVMNGVTGRMGANQHLGRSIAAIRADGGIPLSAGTSIWPDPILVGRNADKLNRLAAPPRIERGSSDLAECPAHADDTVRLHRQTTELT